MSFTPFLTKMVGIKNSRDIKVYQEHGGYASLKKTFEYKPEALVELVKASGLRGRGGAGFSCGMKWSFLPKGHEGPIYMAVNFDESEPGTFKDRYLSDHDPHSIIEGIITSSYATNVSVAYVFIRGEFYAQAEYLEAALSQAYDAGFVGNNILGSGYSLEIIVHRGAGAYICGEETALLEALEGKRGWPRLKPPFPAIEGAFGKPTVINNVETICNVPHIINNGAEWFAAIGTEKSTGSKLYGLSGHINNPGVYEFPLGITTRELIEGVGGGVPNGKRVKGAIPGGICMGVLTESELDCPLDFEGPRENGCLGLGTAGVIVLDEDTCMVNALRNIVHFLKHESCGQCTPCREGSGWMLKTLDRMLKGNGSPADVDKLIELADSMGSMIGKTICGLADGTAWAARGFITKFRSEFEDMVKHNSDLKQTSSEVLNV
jgi:NADH-quinone oxidoreductase subunit F